jgi:nucleotide-binding universal stress UspA family protein
MHTETFENRSGIEPRLPVTARTLRQRPLAFRRRVAAKKVSRGLGDHDLRLLVVVDGESSKRVLQYLVTILARRNRVEVHLAYIASHLPAGLLESGGSELPEREEQVEAELRAAQRRWITAADRKPDRMLRAARAELERAGVAAARIHSCVSSRLDARTTADEVLLLARDRQCRTVVVGHRAHSWFGGLSGGHLAEQLVRRAKGLGVWVID